MLLGAAYVMFILSGAWIVTVTNIGSRPIQVRVAAWDSPSLQQFVGKADLAGGETMYRIFIPRMDADMAFWCRDTLQNRETFWRLDYVTGGPATFYTASLNACESIRTNLRESF